MASRQMLKSMMSSASMRHVARTHLFLNPKAGLRRNKFWKETMQSDVLVFDFQDGCPPGMRSTVAKGLSHAHITYPNKALSVRVTELERDEVHETGSKILDELSLSMKQKQVYWLMLPNCDDAKDVQEYIDMINHIDPNWLKYHGGLQLICETPWGLKNLDSMLGNHREVKAVIAGGGDYFRFAQSVNNLWLPQLRWEVLNAGLRHGVVPVDSPPLALGIECGRAKRQFESARDSGFRSGLILHPLQIEAAKGLFSPCPIKMEENGEVIEPWLEKRETGYKKNSGDDFIGPPHMKQKLWDLKYHDDIRGKTIVHIENVDKGVLSRLSSFLSESQPKDEVTSIPDINTNTEDFTNTLAMIALSTTCHPRHKDLLANLGFSNIKISNNDDGSAKSYRDASYVASQIIGRKLTSSGKLIVTTKVQILNKDHDTLCELERRLMERQLQFESNADEGMYCHLNDEEKNYKRMTLKDITSIIDQATLIQSKPIRSISTEAHFQYCKELHLDAPLHHTEEPTVPSTLHLSHHALENHTDLTLNNVTFHAQMKPDSQYTVSIYALLNHKVEDGATAYLSVLNDSDDRIISSVLFRASSTMIDCEPTNESQNKEDLVQYG